MRDAAFPTLVFFTRATSGPARRMESLLAHVARKERRRLKVRRVDADQHPHLLSKFAVEQVPSLVLVIDQKVVGRIDGRASLSEIEQLLDQQLATPVRWVRNPNPSSPRNVHARGKSSLTRGR
ncbi:MAG TPA: thioredoxin family protein [Gaiellaceae bacterium]